MESQQEISRVEGVIFTELDGDTVILDMATGEYNGLDEVGTLVWKFLEQKATFTQIVDHIMAEYDVDRQSCMADLQAFITEMVEHGLLVYSK